MAEQAAPDGGAPRTRAALAAYKAARAHTTDAELAQRAIVDAWEAEMDAGRILLAAMLEERVLDRLDAAEAVATALGQYDALFDADDPDPAAMMRLRAEAQRHLEAWEAVLATGVGDG